MSSAVYHRPGQVRDGRVVFVQESTELTIRLTDRTYEAILRAANQLKARWIVMFNEDHYTGLQSWGVFDMHKASRDITGTYFPDPVKEFPLQAHDAAVMYAVMLQGRS